MFREFTEFPNPEELDYDITSSKGMGEINQYSMEILNMVGFLEDDEFIKYGITEEEYLHPTQETVDKINKGPELFVYAINRSASIFEIIFSFFKLQTTFAPIG